MADIPPPGATRLIKKAGDLQTFTANRETDARTAITRGMAEYLEQLEIDAFGGRQLRFQKVFATWAEPENDAEYPAACVYATERGTYDASKFTPAPSGRLEPPDGRFLFSSAEFVLPLQIEIRATDPEERMALVYMLEDGLNPVDFMYGVRLELPHYFNERSDYEIRGMAYDDDATAAQQRLRIARFDIVGRVPLIRLAEFPLAKPKTRVEIGDAVQVR